MRGQQALTSILTPSVLTDTNRKSQRNAFIDLRDEQLVHRYFFYAELKGLRHDRCLSIMEGEYFLTGNVIAQRLLKRQDLLKDLVKKKIKEPALRKKYPHLVWN